MPEIDAVSRHEKSTRHMRTAYHDDCHAVTSQSAHAAGPGPMPATTNIERFYFLSSREASNINFPSPFPLSYIRGY